MWGISLPEGFYVGTFYVRLYGIFIASGMLAAYSLTVRIGKKFAISQSQVEGVFVWAIIAGIIGARIYHVIDWWSYYVQFPAQIVMIWQGGLGIYGAIAGGWLGMMLGCWRNKIDLVAMMNSVAPGLILAQAIGRLGNWANMEGFGGPTDLPWKLYISPSLRPENLRDYEFFHPTFIYETVLCLLGLGILWWLVRHSREKYLAGSYLVIYGLIRLFTERFRMDTANWNGLAVADVFSALFIIVGLSLMMKNRRKRNSIM